MPNLLKSRMKSFDFKFVIGFLFIVLGLSISIIINYFTLGPFVPAVGAVSSSEFRLKEKGSQVLVDYTFLINGVSYSNQEAIPVRYHKNYTVGARVRVNYSLINPNLNTLSKPPSPSPLFLISGSLSILGIFLVFGRTPSSNMGPTIKSRGM